MIKALRNSRRDELINLTRRHLKPAVRAYIDEYRRRFGSSSREAFPSLGRKMRRLFRR